MTNPPESPMDRLWNEYSVVFREFDDLTLARWMAQTLGQLQGRSWRMSHPLVGAYRLAAQVAHDREIWPKRLATAPFGYTEAPCCRAPLLPVFTRDILETGLACAHCTGTAVPFEEIPVDLQEPIRNWALEYNPVHEVAHLDEAQQGESEDYEDDFEEAAERAEELLGMAGKRIIPRLAEFYPALVWEDNDECLEVRPEDIET
ncbi:MAG: hypothetical protein H0X66_21065 [Verrucomicrobia bacterium]|nr:hypothetical protein [Verrucomicrobiota bacterium]